MADGAGPGSTTAKVGGARSFGRVVLLGLAGGIAAAVAGNQAWVSVDKAGSDQVLGGSGVQLSLLADTTAPPVTAMALVLLASWGVVLVTRGRFRRALTWLGLLASLGTLTFAVRVWFSAPDDIRAALSAPDLPVSHTAWSFFGVLAAAVSLAASVLAVRSVGDWPEMGRRYDSPASEEALPAVPLEERSSLDLWRSLDEGLDPTERGDD